MRERKRERREREERERERQEFRQRLPSKYLVDLSQFHFNWKQIWGQSYKTFYCLKLRIKLECLSLISLSSLV
jgi:hypothetical protein